MPANSPRPTTDVLVVGGGVVGASIAFHLTRLGAGRVTLLERDRPASGATGRSGALVRTHYTNAPESAMAAAAVPWFAGWPDLVGGDCGFVATGFLQLVNAADHDLLRQNTRMHQDLGIETELVTAAQIRELQPGMPVADDTLAAYESTSGYADPVATTDSLIAAAERNGADIACGMPVRQLLLDGSRITGVETDRGRISAGVVVLANGNWAAPLLGSVGVNVPLQVMRGQAAVVTRPDGIGGPRGHLTVIDRRHGIYLRPHGAGQTLVGLSAAGQNERVDSADDVEVDPTFADRTRTRLTAALPAFADSDLVRTQAGPLDVTPDRCALVGPTAGLDSLVLAIGMSGGGFKKAPALGACVAELVVDGHATTAPLEPFSPDRFARGAAVKRHDYLVGGPADTNGEALIH